MEADEEKSVMAARRSFPFLVILLSLFLLRVTGKAAQPTLRSIPRLDPRWLAQRVDHFNASDTRTFRQKYFVYPAYYKPGGPLLFYCGPETTVLSSATATNLSLAEFASRLNGLVVAAEHRYFGDSLPFGNDSYSIENIRFLTVEQTLRDYISIIQSVQADMKMDGNGVVVFGGSYGGFLSFLMRVHYPDTVSGSIASAAATCTYGDVDDNTWFSLVSETYNNYELKIGDDILLCGKEVELAFAHLYQCIFNDSCRQRMHNELNLCRSVDTIADGFLLLYYAKNAFSSAVQFNYPFMWLPFRTPNPLQKICEPMSPLLRGKWGMQMLYNASGNLACFDYNLKNMTASLGIDTRPFSYVVCRDFPQPIGGVGIFSVPHPVNFSRFSDSCETQWGVRPSLEWWRSFVQEPLLQHGSNIAFSNGGFDPVRGFSPDHDLSSSVRALNVAEMAHTQDILPSFPQNPDSVTRLIEDQYRLIRQWIGLDTQRSDISKFQVTRFASDPPSIKSMCLHRNPRSHERNQA